MNSRSLALLTVILFLASLCVAMQAGQAKDAPAKANPAKVEPTKAEQVQPQASPQQAAPGLGASADKSSATQDHQDSTISKIAGAAPIVTATVAVLFGLLAWRFNERSIRRVARQDHIRMLVDIDKAYMDRPTLWRIYQDEFNTLPDPIPADPWEPARRRGLIYLYLNMFDAAYDFDRHLNWRNLNWRTKSDREYLESWKAFLGDFLTRSPEALQVMNESRRIYSEGFVTFADSLIAPKPVAKPPVQTQGK